MLREIARMNFPVKDQTTTFLSNRNVGYLLRFDAKFKIEYPILTVTKRRFTYIFSCASRLLNVAMDCLSVDFSKLARPKVCTCQLCKCKWELIIIQFLV